MVFLAALAMNLPAVRLSAAAPVDALFLQNSAEDSIAELRLVNMAIKRTNNPRIKRGCQIMIRDHTRELAEIRSLGSRLAIDLPTEPNEMHKALFDHLRKLSGRKFDKSFVGAQLQDHIDDVNKAQDEAEIGNEPRLREFARRGVMLYARHEVIWRKVAPSVGVEKTFGRPSSEEILAGKKP